ncbi:hypothetical protein C9F11_42895 (plasmid) [Streptomyces sp. YIM 121038]|uniref:hypothetical protein n=1 Tax=Streptomyces sp. YIM 121038 TaxID=2136401 RepID=UPI001110B3A5|nr:hypothetical protein [Streptomyces sp. YIM 121038]QCX82159.1 hypothetical protein C9F11_42895 [Streptomyces sp. YIM 121038]
MKTHPPGADEARTLRATAALLAEADDLRNTSARREVLLDLSYALANLAGPVGALVDACAEEQGGCYPADMPDPDTLTDLAAKLRRCATTI